MPFQSSPPLGDAEASALGDALELAGVSVASSPRPQDGAWARVAAREAVGYEPDTFPHGHHLELDVALDERYARSPRRTRGATRA